MKRRSHAYRRLPVTVLLVLLSGCATAATTAPPHSVPAARMPLDQLAPLPRIAAVAAHDPVLRCPRRARACVDVKRGLAWLQSRGRTSYGPVPIATGTRRHPTPGGNFRVVWKARHWVSTEYDVPMPFSLFFAAGGIAFHEGPLNEHSHGCIHLTREAARVFFHRLTVGAHVHVE